MVVFLLGLRADWKAVDKDGDTVLHFACMKEVSHGLHDKTLEFLLTTPVSALKNAQNCRGDTPIMVATRYVNVELDAVVSMVEQGMLMWD